MSDLTRADRVALSRLAAQLRPSEGEAQARAGIYLELNGEIAAADECFENAGPKIKGNLDGLFE